jgi:hypothetical protein
MKQNLNKDLLIIGEKAFNYYNEKIVPLMEIT